MASRKVRVRRRRPRVPARVWLHRPIPEQQAPRLRLASGHRAWSVGAWSVGALGGENASPSDGRCTRSCRVLLRADDVGAQPPGLMQVDMHDLTLWSIGVDVEQDADAPG